jgi:hypothetical protein
MPIYRLFTNDRRDRRDVPMYSALMDVEADNAAEACKRCPPQFDAPLFAPCVAINLAKPSDDDKRWFMKHVDRSAKIAPEPTITLSECRTWLAREPDMGLTFFKAENGLFFGRVNDEGICDLIGRVIDDETGAPLMTEGTEPVS